MPPVAELLLELFSEEIPARMQARAAEDLKRLMTGQLGQAGLEFEAAQSFVTPRRLALMIAGLPKRQPDVVEERKGPRAGSPAQALEGFMRANGLTDIGQAELRDTEKGQFYFAVRRTKGRATAAVLPELIQEVVRQLPWPKSMRWRQGAFRWVRPLHACLAVFDGRKLKGQLDLDGVGLPFTNRTQGHRFLAPKAFAVTDFADYRAKLKQAKVILDPAERRAAIASQAERLAKKAGLAIKDDPALLDEVTGLVEWPVVLMGQIDAAFMDLPPEVLATSMRTHQKYFALLDANGRMADRFLLVANMQTADRGRIIVAGNERVLRARLADARFFWDQDRKTQLDDRVPALSQIIFHAKLGDLAAKVSRMESLANDLAAHVSGADAERARSATRLAKADLVTGMVGEFPELQGVMGQYYARHGGEHDDVAAAIAEHYSPLGPNDRCPSAPVSICVALADKLDTLVGMFAIGETPTGSKDPYALRRAALGVIRLLVENRIRLPLGRLLEVAWQLYANQRLTLRAMSETRDELLLFFADRLKVALKDQGVRHDLIAAVFALGGEDDLVRLLDRVKALDDFLGSDDGANLLVAYRRAANIVRIEEKKDKTAYNGGADSGAFEQDEERVLHDSLADAKAVAESALAAEDFTAAMGALAGLRRPVDAFFDRVTVNAEAPALRANRLRLLAEIGGTLGRVADFSRIEG